MKIVFYLCRCSIRQMDHAQGLIMWVGKPTVIYEDQYLLVSFLHFSFPKGAIFVDSWENFFFFWKAKTVIHSSWCIWFLYFHYMQLPVVRTEAQCPVFIQGECYRNCSFSSTWFDYLFGKPCSTFRFSYFLWLGVFTIRYQTDWNWLEDSSSVPYSAT